MKTMLIGAALAAAPLAGARTQTMSGMEHGTGMDHMRMTAPAPPGQAPPAASPADASQAAAPSPMAGHDMAGMGEAGDTGPVMSGMSGMSGMVMSHRFEAMNGMPAMAGAFAFGSGTSRVPAADPMPGIGLMAGDWMVMAHGYAWTAWTDQGGRRGDDMAYVQSMAMLMAQRPLGDRTRLQLRGMGSAEPLMGQRGYPNLFATGETAHGMPLVDRQHPHDLFMELAARIDRDIGPPSRGGAAFVYAGLPGEPALGPSAFMHRGSARFIPDAPITHHWFDSTHITFGVVTAGYGTRRWQVEASAFNGREPGENRYNIETGALDSWSVRGTWTPVPSLAAQVSYGHLVHPEKTHARDDENRLTASLSYAVGPLALTAGVARKDRVPGDGGAHRALVAWLAEATWDVARRHAVFGRVETVANDELFEAEPLSPLHDRIFRVTRVLAGYAYTLPLGRLASLALGATGSVYAKPAALDAAYGKAPVSVTLFAKLMLGRR